MSYLMIRHVGRSNSPFFYVQRPFFRSKKGLLRKINPLFKGKIIAVIVFWLGGWVRQNVSGAAPSGHCTPAETANAEWSAADSSWVGLRAWDLKPSSRARILFHGIERARKGIPALQGLDRTLVSFWVSTHRE
jgi:hypothetical protein